MPCTIGFINTNNVQIAAIPMVPTPIKRTLVFHIAMAKSTKLTPAGRSPDAVKNGTATPQVRIVPINIAIPPTIPIK